MLRRPVTGAGWVRRWLRLVSGTVLALASAAMLLLTGYAWTLSRQLDASLTTSAVLDHPRANPARPRLPAVPDAMNVLLVGLDSRTDAQGNPLPPPVLAALHAGGDDGELNADTLILVHLATAPRQPPVAVSIPRDSYVTVPGFGPHKINSALQRAMLAAKSTLIAQGLSGAGLDRLAQQAGRQKLVQTVEQLTGVTLDHYVEINLAGFYEITQAVGGVPVCLAAPTHDSYTGADFAAGPQTVSGAAALAFVRQRHGLPRGDLDRIQRQQAYLSGLAHQLLSAHLLTDPAAVAALRQAITRYVVIDPGWDLAGLLDQAASLQAAAIQFRTIPTGRIDLPTPDGQAVQVDPEQVHQFIAQLINRTDRLPQPPSTTAPAVAPLASSFPCVS